MAAAMTRMPRRWFNRRVTVEPLLGRTGRGLAFGDEWQPIRCRVEQVRRLVRGDDGEEFVSATVLQVPPEAPTIPKGSRVTLEDGTTGVVAEVTAVDGRRTTVYREVVLR